MELNRLLNAFQELQQSPDWRRLAGIHGGCFIYNQSYGETEAEKQELEALNQVLLAKARLHAAQTLAAKRQTQHGVANAFSSDFTRYWFCAHENNTFAIWHRPYMAEFEAALQRADERANGKEHPHKLGLPYWKWDPFPEEIPDIFLKPYFKFGKGQPSQWTWQPNPLFSSRGKPKDGEFSDMNSASTTFRLNNLVFSGKDHTLYPGMDDSWYQLMLRLPKYELFATKNACPTEGGSTYSVEEPHNLLHNWTEHQCKT